MLVTGLEHIVQFVLWGVIGSNIGVFEAEWRNGI